MVACLWPFEFHPHNDVVYVPGEQALRFYGLGTAYSREPFPSLPSLSQCNELTIEMTIRPARIFNSGVPCILSFVPEQGPPALVIGAWKKSLVVRLGRPNNAGWKKYREIGIDNVFVAGQTVHLAISFGPHGTTIFVDGRFGRFFPDASLSPVKTPLGRLLLGNSSKGGSLWKGDILALALSDRGLVPTETATGAATGAHPDYIVSNGNLIAHYRLDNMKGNLIPNTSSPGYNIVIPPFFSPLRRTVLEPPRWGVRLSFSSLHDIVLNILGFMPFGFIAMLYVSSAGVIPPRLQSSLVVLAGFLLSLSVELIQVFIPTRSSTLTDLSTNTLGSALGVILYAFVIAVTARNSGSRKLLLRQSWY